MKEICFEHHTQSLHSSHKALLSRIEAYIADTFPAEYNGPTVTSESWLEWAIQIDHLSRTQRIKLFRYIETIAVLVDA